MYKGCSRRILESTIACVTMWIRDLVSVIDTEDWSSRRCEDLCMVGMFFSIFPLLCRYRYVRATEFYVEGPFLLASILQLITN